MLTPKRERFVVALVAGMSQRAAYRFAYDAERMSDKTVDKRASELANNGEVKGRYDDLMRDVASKVQWDREQAARELLEAIGLAMDLIRQTAGATENFTDDGRRQIADLPLRAAQFVIAAIGQLERMFPDDSGGTGEPVLIDDLS